MLVLGGVRLLKYRTWQECRREEKNSSFEVRGRDHINELRNFVARRGVGPWRKGAFVSGGGGPQGIGHGSGHVLVGAAPEVNFAARGSGIEKREGGRKEEEKSENGAAKKGGLQPESKQNMKALKTKGGRKRPAEKKKKKNRRRRRTGTVATIQKKTGAESLLRGRLARTEVSSSKVRRAEAS